MRDVLVALCGLTPQVVTETLWALARRTPPVYPAEVWIVTTKAGLRICERRLFGRRGALARYRRDHRSTTQPLRYGPDHVLVLKGANGKPLEDVRSDSDNQAVADQLADFLRQHTACEQTRVHCSLAGGRKTMGVLLAGALQLFGRAEDRLYHVLVPSTIEQQPDFFYPDPRARRRSMQIELADIPYVRLRGLLPDAPRGGSRFTELVAHAEHELRALTNPDILRIDRTGSPHPRIMIGDNPVTMRPDAARLYTAFARIKKEHCVKPELRACDHCTACFVPISGQKWDQTKGSLQPLAGIGTLPESVEPVRSLISKMNQALAKALQSPRVAQCYAIRSVGERHEKRYGLAANKTAIQVEP